MATISSVAPANIGGITTVGAWKSSAFGPAKANTPRFPGIGDNIPATSPDVSASVTPGSPVSLTTPTDEPYYVGFYGATNKVLFSFQFHVAVQNYVPGPSPYRGPGAPPSSFTTAPDGAIWISTTSGAPGSRVWISWGGVWTATAA